MKDQEQSVKEAKNSSGVAGKVEKDIQSVIAEIRERWSRHVAYRQDCAATSARRLADIETLLGIVEPVTRTAYALCQQLHAVHDDPRYRAVWESAQLHRGQYDGPKYENELNNLERLLR